MDKDKLKDFLLADKTVVYATVTAIVFQTILIMLGQPYVKYPFIALLYLPLIFIQFYATIMIVVFTQEHTIWNKSLIGAVIIDTLISWLLADHLYWQRIITSSIMTLIFVSFLYFLCYKKESK